MTDQLHYHLHGCGDGQRGLLVLHELGGSTRSWQWALGHLGGERAVLAVDLPGHGESPLPGPDATLDDYAAAVAGVLDELGWVDFDLVGVALGGIVAPFVDRRLPDENRRVVLSATPFELSQRVADYCRRRADVVRASGPEAVVEDSLRNSFPPHLHGSTLQADYRALFVRNDPGGYAEASYALANLDNARQRENFENLRGRVGLICGAQDPLFPVHEVQELAAFLGLKDGPAVLPDGGHFPHVQDPSGFARAVAEVCAGAERGRG